MVAWGIQFHSVRSGHQIPVKILVEGTRSIWDVVTLLYYLPHSDGRVDKMHNSNIGRYDKGLRP